MAAIAPSVLLVSGCVVGPPASRGELASNGPSPTAASSQPAPRSTEIDGSIVFARAGDIAIVDRTGERVLVTSSLDSSPGWSPDGTRIIFVSNRDGPDDVYTMLPDGSGVQRLTESTLNESAAGWSPNGNSIAFVTFADPGGGQVWVMRANDGDAKRIYEDANAFIGFQEWSPDGRLLLGIDKAGGGQLDLFSIAADGSDLVPVVTNPGDDSGGRFSDDGMRLAFWSDVGPDRAGAGIYIRASDGTMTKVYADTLGLDTVSLAWSPDGRHLAWAGKYEGGRSTPIYVMSADGRDQRQLSDPLPQVSRLDWK